MVFHLPAGGPGFPPKTGRFPTTIMLAAVIWANKNPWSAGGNSNTHTQYHTGIGFCNTDEWRGYMSRQTDAASPNSAIHVFLQNSFLPSITEYIFLFVYVWRLNSFGKPALRWVETYSHLHDTAVLCKSVSFSLRSVHTRWCIIIAGEYIQTQSV